jgi:predicted nucleotidyltransferase
MIQIVPKNAKNPTSDSELNAVLHEFVTGIQSLLGTNFIAAYLQGSFAVGDWDADSDVDFLVAIEHEISETDLPALQALHAKIFHAKTGWAKCLEGSYFPRDLLKHGDPTKTALLFLDNAHDQLIKSAHDNSLVVRWVVREHGITLAGPDADELIDPVSADDLRAEISVVMQDWAEEIFTGGWHMNNRWAQPFAVLSYCRMLHTLQTGRIHSKLAGAKWAQNALDRQWANLIQRAWEARPNPSLKVQQPADANEIESTLAFIRYTLTSIRS